VSDWLFTVFLHKAFTAAVQTWKLVKVTGIYQE